MKIVQLIYSLSSGGAERFVVDLSNELVRQGHEVHLVVFRSNEGSEFYKPFIESGVLFHNLGIEEGFSLFRVLKVMMALHRINPDIVHSHLNVIPYIYFLSFLRRDIKFLHTLHSSARYTVGGKFQYLINRIFYKRGLIHPVAISQKSNDSYRDFYCLPGAVVIDNGRSKVQPTSSFESARSEVLSYLGGRKKPIFIHVARFHPAKNQDLLISSFNRLYAEGIDFVLLVIGNGYGQSGSAKSLRDRSCSSIKFLGEKANVGDYLLQADAFCLTSKYEGLPISLLEALSAGCVPICTAVGGISDVITDGLTGYLSDGLDIDGFCSAVKRYLHCPDAVGRDFLNEYFNSKYSIEECARSYISVYESL